MREALPVLIWKTTLLLSTGDVSPVFKEEHEVSSIPQHCSPAAPQTRAHQLTLRFSVHISLPFVTLHPGEITASPSTATQIRVCCSGLDMGGHGFAVRGLKVLWYVHATVFPSIRGPPFPMV